MDSGDYPRASASKTWDDAHRHYAYLDSWADDVDCGWPTGAAPDSQLHGQQLAQRAGGAIGVSGAPLVSPAEAVFVSPAPAWALELNAPRCMPAGTSPASGPSVSCTPAVGGASTLAELDGITVTKPLGR